MASWNTTINLLYIRRYFFWSGTSDVRLKCLNKFNKKYLPEAFQAFTQHWITTIKQFSYCRYQLPNTNGTGFLYCVYWTYLHATTQDYVYIETLSCIHPALCLAYELFVHTNVHTYCRSIHMWNITCNADAFGNVAKIAPIPKIYISTILSISKQKYFPQILTPCKSLGEQKHTQAFDKRKQCFFFLQNFDIYILSFE